MTWMDRTFMGSDPHKITGTFGAAVAAQLRRRHSFHTAKSVAQSLQVGLKTAENILDGHLSSRTLTLIVMAYGPGIVIEAAAGMAGHTLETFIVEQAAHAEQAEARARERARELHRLRTKLHPDRRCGPGVDRPAA